MSLSDLLKFSFTQIFKQSDEERKVPLYRLANTGYSFSESDSRRGNSIITYLTCIIKKLVFLVF